MQFHVSTVAAAKQRTHCLMLPVYADGERLPAATRSVDRAMGGHIGELLEATAHHPAIVARQGGLGGRCI